MLSRRHDPIIAIATAPGRGAVGIIRLSGPSLLAFGKALLGRELTPRHAHYLPIGDAQGQSMDHGLALYFKAPHSYTGEDVLELQVHGGPVMLQLLLARCLEVASTAQEHLAAPAPLPALRMAEAGEFTQRAFLNGKLDLAQAEAVADLIDASTQAAARSAGRSLEGAFSREVNTLREALVQLRMLVEATLDFPEEDIDFLQQADAKGQLQKLQQHLAQIFACASQGQLLREGIHVVIAGQPNAGKSSLLNALAGAELAIVTPIAGTTRDKVQQIIQIEGVPLHVVDTAGLRDSEDEVERMGIERAWQAIADADAVLFLHDLTRADQADYQQADRQIADELQRRAGTGAHVIHLWNKADAVEPAHGMHEGIHLSAKTGKGLEDLRHALLELAGWRGTTEGIYMARERHLQALTQVREQLQLAQAQIEAAVPAPDLLAEELRQAQNALNSITGEFTSDDLLGVIFSRFCIGK